MQFVFCSGTPCKISCTLSVRFFKDPETFISAMFHVLKNKWLSVRGEVSTKFIETWVRAREWTICLNRYICSRLNNLFLPSAWCMYDTHYCTLAWIVPNGFEFRNCMLFPLIACKCHKSVLKSTRQQRDKLFFNLILCSYIYSQIKMHTISLTTFSFQCQANIFAKVIIVQQTDKLTPLYLKLALCSFNIPINE